MGANTTTDAPTLDSTFERELETRVAVCHHAVKIDSFEMKCNSLTESLRYDFIAARTMEKMKLKVLSL